MTNLKNLTIVTRLNLVMGGFVVLTFTIFGFYVNFLLQKQILNATDERMIEQVNDLVGIIAVELQGNKEKVSLSMHLASNYFKRQGELVESREEFVSFNAVNQITGSAASVSVNKWYQGGRPVQNNYDVVDAISGMGVATATIFQKVAQGYLRVSTNVKSTDGNRAVGTFIPFDAPVAQTIDRGQAYTGRAWVVNDWYLTAYEPLKIKDEIKGMLYVGMPEKNLPKISEMFSKKKILTRATLTWSMPKAFCWSIPRSPAKA